MMSSSRRSANEKVLTEYDGYIRRQARSTMYGNSTLTHPDVYELEVDELAQRTRINVWGALEKHPIHNLTGFTRTVVHHESVTMFRQYKRQPVVPLLVNDEGELYYSDMLPRLREKDPADILEQEELGRERLQKIIDAVLKLPRMQQRAAFCMMKDIADDLVLLRKLCWARNIDLDALNWPTTTAEVQSMRSSISAAKKKLRNTLRLECADDPYVAAVSHSKAG
ncbi:MAG TPA: hypothetical protein VHZ51_26990 [Ktedonobacteraceae bacterium]|nr:hypothetical protein [Ktedonobacteraceae bacterium]